MKNVDIHLVKNIIYCINFQIFNHLVLISFISRPELDSNFFFFFYCSKYEFKWQLISGEKFIINHPLVTSHFVEPSSRFLLAGFLRYPNMAVELWILTSQQNVFILFFEYMTQPEVKCDLA